MKTINEKTKEEIDKIKDFIKEWQGILLAVLVVAVLVFLIGLGIYLNRSKKVEEIEIEGNCHYEAIKKAQEKYNNEISGPSQCLYCNEEENEGTYRKQDYRTYYQECLKENTK